MKKILFVIVLLSISIFADKITLLNPNTNDMVYHTPLKEYKRFICEAKLQNGKTVQFVAIKSMIQVYWHQRHFFKVKLISAKIKDMYVQDFRTGEKINAKTAFYVIGSSIVGPNGANLIPFKSIKSAKLFEKEYGGSKILSFKDLSLRLIELLDME